MPFSSQIKRLWPKAGSLGLNLQADDLRKPGSRRTTVAICLAIFLLAVGVRVFQWQDNRTVLPRVFSGMVGMHKANAGLLLKGDIATFIKGPAPPGDANIIAYPPGYPIIMATVFKLFGDSDSSMRLFQILCDAAAAVLLFLVAAELLPTKAAAVAAGFAALSPQLAYYSLLLIPDSLATLPILLALYFLIRAHKRKRLGAVIAAGVCIGLSCWLRSNALLLAPFLAILLLITMERSRRWRFAAALVGATILVIAPITIRNLVVFHHFVPLSLGAGQMLNIGISDYDRERRFGLPGTDMETMTREAKEYGRPEYGHNLFGGNGIEREGDRISRALAVVRAHPVWFAGVVLRRAVFMLKLERVHIISPQPAVTHSLNVSDQMKPAWSLEPADLVAGRMTGHPPSQISIAANSTAARIEGSGLQAANRIVSLPIAVEKNSDYLFRIPVKVEQGHVVISVTSPDQEQVYGSTPVLHALETAPGAGPQTYLMQIPFVSREAGTVQLVMRNEERRPALTVIEVGKVELFKLGPASLLWTKYLRALLHFAQRFFVTAWMLPLALIGIVLWKLDGGGRYLAVVLAIPLYYLSAQSFLHTEYRYVMAMQPSLFILVAATLYWLGRIVRHRFRTAKADV